MRTRHEYRGLTWIDLQSPNTSEGRAVAQECGVSPIIAEGTGAPNCSLRAAQYCRVLFLVMQCPSLRHSTPELQQEVSFLLGRNFLMTTHYDTIDTLHKFSKVFDTHAALANEPLGDHAGFLFFYVLRKLYHSIDHELEKLQSDLFSIEDHIFQGREVTMVESISHTARGLLDLRQTIEPHREVLQSLEEHGVVFFGEDFMPFLRTLTREYFRVHNHLMRVFDFLQELRETNNSLLTTKQNETLKVYTIMAFFTFPLALITSILGIQSVYNPVLGRPYDFWIMLGILLAALLSMFIFFKRKKWL